MENGGGKRQAAPHPLQAHRRVPPIWRSKAQQCAAPHPCHALHQLVVQLAVRHLQEALEQDTGRDEVLCLETRAGKQKQRG